VNESASSPTPEALSALYDGRYEGEYMSGDGFGRWSHTGAELRRVNDTLSLIEPTGICSILDYGCGRGEWGEALRGHFPEAEITGIDISSTAIGRARQANPGRTFRSFDGVRAPFEDGVFDLVFSYHVLEHVLDIDAVVKDMSRLVRPGGWLCIIFPCGNPGSFEANLAARVAGGVELSAVGEPRFFFEDTAHLRRMPSAGIIDIFRRHDVVLRESWFAHQFFGAIEWISSSGRSFVKGLFDTRRAIGTGARLRLFLMTLIMTPLATLHDLSTIDLTRRGTASKRLLLQLLRPLRFIGSVVSRCLETLAELEWRYRRKAPNGSAQFLVFRKQRVRLTGLTDA
jgi:SAM-dependent methyltransferase